MLVIKILCIILLMIIILFVLLLMIAIWCGMLLSKHDDEEIENKLHNKDNQV